MKLLVTLIIIVATCLPALCTETSDPTSGLDKPVTLAVKGESLIDVVRMMEKQTAVKLRVSKDIQEQKVTIFVDKMPLRDVMNGICTVFDFRFSFKVSHNSDTKVYEIWEPEKNSETRVNTTIQAEADAWKRVETLIAKGIAYSSLDAEERAKIRAEIPADTKDTDLRELADLYRLIDEDPLTSTLISLVDTDPRILDALRSGLSVHFDNRSTESDWKVPQSVLEGLPAIAKLYPTDGLPELLASYAKGNESKYAFMHLGFSPELNTNRNSVSVRWYFEYSRSGGSSCSLLNDFGSADLKNEDRTTVQVSLPHAGDPEFLDRKVSLTAAELVKEAALPDTVKPSHGIQVNRSDILALLHKHIGVQVISDHYSFWHRMDPVQERSVAEVLDRFSCDPLTAGSGRSSQEAVRGWDDRLLYMRIQQRALADAAEIPNAPLRRWRDVSRKHGCLGLDELSEIAWLSDNQIKGLQLTAGFHGIDAPSLDQLETGTFVTDSAAALKLYGLLDKVQRQQALAAGTPIDSFIREQYMILAEMLNKVVKPGIIFKAGVYKGEIRVDKQDTGKQMQPVTLQISSSLGSGYQYNPPNLEASEWIVAETPADAWRKVSAKHPSANKKDLTIILASGFYHFTVSMADGSSHTWDVSAGQNTPNYADWEREQKQSSPPISGNAKQ
jgi:hypothetical protein